jgi:hypothetical protein
VIASEPTTSQELRDFARVLKAALCLLIQFWTLSGDRYPPQHPYRQGATMVLRYIERRYGV